MLDDGEKYDPTVNPATSQEFSTGALRVLHNIVPAQHRCEKRNTWKGYLNFQLRIHFRFVDSNYTTVKTINVTDWTYRPYLLEQESNYDDLLRGLLYTEGRPSQPSYNELVLFELFLWWKTKTIMADNWQMIKGVI